MHNEKYTSKKNTYAGKLLVTDLDGTLLNSKKEISRENHAALKEFTENGGLFTVATGRMEGTVVQYASSLPINVPAILYNGSVIYDFSEKKVIWENFLEEDVVDIVVEAARRFPGIGIELLHNDTYFYLEQNSYTEMHHIRDRFSPKIMPLESIYSIPKPWSQIVLVWDSEKLIEVEAFVKELLMKSNNKTIRMVYSEAIFLILLNINASKGEALKDLIKILDIPVSDVIAIGDNQNDVEMIQAAGIGIAVDNARAELKEVADFCCCGHDEHVIPYVLKWLKEDK